MTSNERKLKSLAAQLKLMSYRVEKLIGGKEPKGKAKAAPKDKAANRTNYIGKVIAYGGAKAKVVEKDGRDFVMKALGNLEARGKKVKRGKTFKSSYAFVYKSLSA